jgi:hypothetical protein
MDGTFKIVRPPFVQLFTINVFLAQNVQVPGIYVLMSGKSTQDYERVSTPCYQYSYILFATLDLVSAHSRMHITIWVLFFH